MEPANKGHFEDNKYSADLFFVERFTSLGGSKCTAGNIPGPQAVSFVERFIVLCPYLKESTSYWRFHCISTPHTQEGECMK